MDLKIEVKLDKNTLKVVEGLVEALKGITVSAPQAEAVPELVVTPKNTPQEEVNPTPEPVAPAPQAPVPTLPATETVAPINPVPTPTPVPVAPTQTIKYTVQQLAVAAMQLKDQGRIADLQGLLVQFGVASMVELKDDQLDSFAQALRGLGVTL